MIRHILRNVQNTLVFSSALLVILALQRMQSFDYHHNQNRPHDHLSHQDESGESFDSQAGSDHHTLFGREFSVGLFRFALPRFESVEAGLPARDTVKKRSTSSSEKMQMIIGSKESAPTIAYVLEIAECTSQVLDSAAVLQHSVSKLSESESYHLRAILPSPLVDFCGPKLQRLGYLTVDRGEIVVPESLEQFKSDICVSDDTIIELYAMDLEMDLVVRTSLPSIVLPIESEKGVTRAPDASIGLQKHNMAVEGQRTGTHILVPSKNASVSFVNDVLRHCALSKSRDDKPVFSQSSWQNCGPNCNLSKYVMVQVLSFDDCPVPWDCVLEDVTERGSHWCHYLQSKWFQFRQRVEQRHDHAEQPVDEVVSPPENLVGRYCLRSGPEGYLPMQRVA